MGPSLRLGRFAGIDVFVHWTFALLVAYVLGAVLLDGQPLGAALAALALVLATFGCVVLHEYGHALTARRYGVPTTDITLYPIGGVARLERIPEKPSQELAVAIAGPLVNVAIALLIGAGLLVTGTELAPLVGLLDPTARFWSTLLWINVVLVVFNLIPAFPMDGGRILRSLLAMALPYERATRIAARVGQVLAVGFAVWGVLGGGVMLIVIAAFVFLGASQESGATQMRRAIRGVPVRDAMLTDFATLGPASTLGDAVAALLAGSAQEFPVLGVDGRIAGVLTRKRLIAALSEAGPGGRVVEAMAPACPAVEANAMLSDALDRLQRPECALLGVESGGRLVGILTVENIAELLMVQRAVGAG